MPKDRQKVLSSQCLQYLQLKGQWILDLLPSKWDYWENLQINKLFDLVKYTKTCYIFHWDLKNVHAFFKSVL